MPATYLPLIHPRKRSAHASGRQRRSRGGVINITPTMQNSVRVPFFKKVHWPYHRQPFFGRGRPNLHLRKNAYSETDNRKLFLSTLPKTHSGFMRVPAYVKPTIVTRAYAV